MERQNGSLPPGVHKFTWDEFDALVVGEFPASLRRPVLVTALRRVHGLLRMAGASRVVIGGSMVTDKPEPEDCDGWFDITLAGWGTDGDRFVSALRRLDPGVLWSWEPRDRIEVGGRLRSPQWARYRVDLYPQIVDMEPEITIGADGYPRQFPEEFFQYARDGARQGVAELIDDA